MAKQKWKRPKQDNAQEDIKKGETEPEELKRNKIFDFAGELSMKVCPDVKVMVLNHDVKSIIFTATFTNLSQNDIDGVIEVSK